jgi:urease accessory protein
MKPRHSAVMAVLLALWAGPASAHPGHGGSAISAGLLHPITGADHLVAMLLVGLWAGLVAGHAKWVLPAAFLSAMLGGFGLGAAGLAGPGAMTAEVLILASLLILGAAVAVKLRTPVAIAASAIGLFGFAHGLAHGLEAPGGALPIGFAAGFLISAATLHGAGLALARLAPAKCARAGGLLGVGLGTFLMAAT